MLYNILSKLFILKECIPIEIFEFWDVMYSCYSNFMIYTEQRKLVWSYIKDAIFHGSLIIVLLI